MTKKRKALLAAMALCLCGSAVGVFAYTYQVANASDQGNFDKAVYLYWGEGKTSETLANIDNLDTQKPEYRYLTVSPKTSASMKGTVTVNFALTDGDKKDEKTYSLKNLVLSVYKTDTLLDDTTVEGWSTAGKTAAAEIEVNTDPDGKRTTEKSVSIEVGTREDNHEVVNYYLLKFERKASVSTSTYFFGGNLTISQSFTAKAAA